MGKPKILVTVFQMLKCERTGNMYKHAQSLLELCRACAESKILEVHTSLITGHEKTQYNRACYFHFFDVVFASK